MYHLYIANCSRDHVISVWKLDEEEKVDEITGPEFTLNANECISSLDAIESADSNGEFVVGCVTKSGVFHAFELDVNSKRKKKVARPKATVQVATERDPKNKGAVAKIPVLACKLEDGGNRIRLAHGSYLGPAFESMEYEKLDKVTCLVRKGADSASEKHKETAGTKLMVSCFDRF